MTNSQAELISFHKGSYVIRNITEIAMLEEEKVFEVETMQPELYSLSWLNKVAPCFPVNGSKVNMETP